MKNKHAQTIGPSSLRCVFLLLTVLTFAQCYLSAQSGLVHTLYYSVDDGLSGREVLDIFQDDQGFIWLATANGVNRFDGYKFESFNNLPNTAFKISGNDPVEIKQIKGNKLLIRYDHNWVFFDLLDLNSYESTKVFLLPETGIKGFAKDIYVTPDGELYVLSLNDEGIRIYQYQEGENFRLIMHFEEEHEKKISPVSFIITPDDDFLINDSENGLKLISKDGEVKQTFSAENLQINNLDEQKYPGTANIFHQDELNRVWLSFDKTPGIISLLPALDSCYQITTPDFLPQQKYFAQLWEDQQSNILISTTSNYRNPTETEMMICLKPDGSSLDFNHIISPRQQTTALYSTNFFRTIFFGLDTGFKIVQNNLSAVKTFAKEEISEDQRGTIIRGITGDQKSKIYITQEQDHWFVLDLQTDFLDTLNIVDRDGFPILIDCSYSLYLDDQGFLWGTSCQDNDQGLLIKYDTANCIAETFAYESQFTALAAGHDSKLWLTAASSDGQGELVSFDRTTEQFKKYFNQKGDNPLLQTTTYYLSSMHSGELCIGTNRGLLILNPKNDSLTVVKRNEEDSSQPDNLQSNDIIAIHEDEEGKLWLGTTNGLSILDPSTGQTKTLKKEDGLPSNIVCGILPDGKGNYWVSTYNGISFYSPEYGLFRKFYSGDGFSHNEFNRFSFYKDHRGRFYFGGVNGFNAFYPHDLIVATSAPGPKLTQITRFSSESDSIIHQKRNLHSLKNLEINPYDSYFQVHFMLPVFSRTDKNQFSAWLEGYEPEWTNLGNSSFVRYNNLPAGKYTLHINGADPNGNPSQEPILLNIRVHPKFYTTWWFILGCVLFFIGLAYGIFRYQLDQQLRVERLRTRLSSDIHDEVSGLLSGIAMQTDVLRETTKETYMQEKLKAVGETSRKAMSKMSDIIWSTDSRKDRMSDLVERMREHADDILLKLNIPYDFRVEKVDEHRKIPVHIRQNLYFIYKEAINNIAKHADASRVNIRLANQGNSFHMMIHNDGRPKTNQSKKGGQGMSNMKMRAQRINANVDIFNHDGFTVKIHMKKFV